MVQDDPKLLDDNGKLPKANRVVGGLIPGHEIVYVLDILLARWSITSSLPKKTKQLLTMYMKQLPIR